MNGFINLVGIFLIGAWLILPSMESIEKQIARKPLDVSVERAAFEKLEQDKVQKEMRYVYSNENRMGIK